MQLQQRRNRQNRIKSVLAAIVALAMMAALLLAVPGKALADETTAGTLVIKEQPKSVEVSYPEGATFHVEVEKPEDVASYEWTYSDGIQTYTLDGSSASTDTLVLPSTKQDNGNAVIQCKITDKQGKTYTTKEATLTIKNQDENKSVLYVGDYAVEPGGTLNLADTGLGKGTVTFDADGSHLTFENITYDNSIMTFGHAAAPAEGLSFICKNPQQSEYHFDFKGTCTITNTYVAPDGSGNATLQAFFACEDNARPMLFIGGDGKLIIKGGSTQIDTDADLEVEADLKTDVFDKSYCDGIRAGDIFVDEGVHLQMNVNGTALCAENDIRVYDNAKINIRSVAPHVVTGPTNQSIVLAGGSLYAKNAGINIIGIADPENFLPYESTLESFNAIALAMNGNLNLDATKVYIDMSMIYAGQPFAQDFAGIVGGGVSNAISMENAASIDINMTDPEAERAGGIKVPGIVELNPGCSIAINVQAAEEALGMEMGSILTVDDGVVDSTVTSANDGATYGLICGEISINLSASNYYVHSKVDEGGIAIAADTGERGKVPTEFEPSYKAEKIQLLGKADLLEPERNDISRWGIGNTIIVETVFDTRGTERPATEVVIGQGNSLIWLYCVIAGVIILVLIIIFFLHGRRRAAKKKAEESAAAEEKKETEETTVAEAEKEAKPEAPAGEAMKKRMITVDTMMCVQCGACIKDCPVHVLAFDWHHVPGYIEGGEEQCTGCQQCEAICPAGALVLKDIE